MTTEETVKAYKPTRFYKVMDVATGIARVLLIILVIGAGVEIFSGDGDFTSKWFKILALTAGIPSIIAVFLGGLAHAIEGHRIESLCISLGISLGEFKRIRKEQLPPA